MNIPSTHVRYVFAAALTSLVVLVLCFGSLLALAAGAPLWTGVVALAMPLIAVYLVLMH